MKKLHLTVIGAIFASLLLFTTLSAAPALAQCPEDDPDCPLEPPQSEQIDTDPVNADGSTGETDDPGAIKPVESDLEGDGPRIIGPVLLAPSGVSPPDFDKVDIPIRWQEPTDVSCGVQALGMAFDGLGGGSPTSSAILEHLQSNNMMYDFGTGVEELAYAAQTFGYEGTRPFHNWSLSDLQDELNEGRAPLVAIGANGAGKPGHFVTVTGISPDGKWVSYNDPTLGEQTITAEEFNRLWGVQGNSGVAVRKTVPVGEENLVPWVAFAATLMAIISQTPLALKRMGIGGKITIAGGATTRRRSISPRLSSRPRRIRPRLPARSMPRRRFRPRSRPTQITQQPTPVRDPSPQMRNDAPPISSQHWKEKLLTHKPPPKPEPILETVPKFTSDPLGWFQASVINLGRKSEGAKNAITTVAEGWDKYVKPAVNTAAEFTTGVVYQAVKNTFEPAGYVATLISPQAREDLPEAVRNIEKYTLPDTNATRLGRIFGSIGSLIVSGIFFVKGGATIGGGAVACGTGVLCAAGAPAIALGGFEMVAAGSVAVTSTKALVEQIAAFSSNSAGRRFDIDPENIDAARIKMGYREKQRQHYERQLSDHGRASLERSRLTLLEEIQEHLKKLESIREAGGYTSSIEREIQNWLRELNAIDEILGRLP
jgi:hypothetical protein